MSKPKKIEKKYEKAAKEAAKTARHIARYLGCKHPNIRAWYEHGKPLGQTYIQPVCECASCYAAATVQHELVNLRYADRVTHSFTPDEYTDWEHPNDPFGLADTEKPQ